MIGDVRSFHVLEEEKGAERDDEGAVEIDRRADHAGRGEQRDRPDDPVRLRGPEAGAKPRPERLAAVERQGGEQVGEGPDQVDPEHHLEEGMEEGGLGEEEVEGVGEAAEREAEGGAHERDGGLLPRPRGAAVDREPPEHPEDDDARAPEKAADGQDVAELVHQDGDEDGTAEDRGRRGVGRQEVEGDQQEEREVAVDVGAEEAPDEQAAAHGKSIAADGRSARRPRSPPGIASAYTHVVVGDADYRVGLGIYNGPLDLLLFLIRERELDIHDIPVAEITEQFLAHLEVVKRIDVDRAGDFLLMAATLMLIKSRMLLPDAVEEEEGDDDLDPRTDLVRQLLEYKRFKDASYGLADAQRIRELRFEGGLDGPPDTGPDAGKLLQDVGVGDLLLAFERMMRETLAEVDHQVFREELPLHDVEETIAAQLGAAQGPLLFRELFAERRDRLYIVSVFLCLLEMLKRHRIEIERGRDIVELRIRLKPAEEPAPAAVPGEVEAPLEAQGESP